MTPAADITQAVRHRYYPSTRERITRAMDEGVKSKGPSLNPYARRNSGRPLARAWLRGWFLTVDVETAVACVPVVDLSAEMADVLKDVEADVGRRLERGN